jgi:serine protease Do
LAGAKVVNLSPAVAEELETPGKWQGVAVLEVASRSPARRFGFRPGDIILEVDRQPSKTVDDLQGLLHEDVNGWVIRFERGGRVSTLRIQN